jgi:SAM-dependent methyltransferase
MSDANADQIDYWNDRAGATWAEFQDRLDRQLEPLGAAAMAALDLQPGESVLDIGCGCGQTTLALAERAGKDGRVLGVDISQPMLAVARRRLDEMGAGTSGTVLQADAQTHAFAPRSFDAAFSRFGVMFFADPAAAFANIRKALKPGGRLAFVCWRAFEANPWMSVPIAVAAPHLPPPAPPADVKGDPPPGPFAFAERARVLDMLKTAGFSDVVLTSHDQKIGAGDLDATLGLALRVGPLGAAMREHPETRDLVVGAVRAALASYETPHGVLLPSGTWIVTATA